jgi:hypothetical protein
MRDAEGGRSRHGWGAGGAHLVWIEHFDHLAASKTNVSHQYCADSPEHSKVQVETAEQTLVKSFRFTV